MTKLDQTLTMLKDLTDAKGVPGNERDVKKVMQTYIESYADEVSTDRLGSLIAKKEGNANGPKIMLAGHLDEVGFMVTKIDDKGYIRFQTVGGWWSQVMLAQRVTIVTKKGEITGVIGSKPPHVLSPEARKSQLRLRICLLILGRQAKNRQWSGACCLEIKSFLTLSLQS